MTALLSRRRLIAGLAALPAAPALLRAQSLPPEFGAAVPDQLHALVVLAGGETRFAAAFAGPGLKRPANVKSVSKTVVATLAGCAVARGVLPGPEAPVLPLLGRDAAGPLAGLKVADLLSMQGGVASTSGPDYGAWVSSRDWVGFVLDQPLVAEPGRGFVYSTGTFHLLGAALAEASGRSLLALARDWLGDPLGIEVPAWIRDPQGYYLGGNEMALTPEALARFGRMILDDGRWQGAQVVPADWIAASWEPRSLSPFSGDRYGWGWFLTRFAGSAAAYARGYGGQFLVVVPDRDLVIAVTSDPTLPARGEGYFGELRALVGRIVAAA